MLQRNILIVDPFITTGGGTRVLLSIARSLSTASFTIDIVSLKSLNFRVLEELHGIPLNDIVSKGLLKIYHKPSHQHLISVRYFSYRDFKNLVRTFLKLGSYRAVFFFDDILKIEELLDLDIPVFLYIHFSYMHRILSSFFEEPMKEIRFSKLELLKERLMRKLLSNFFVPDPQILRNVNIFVNSTITRLFTRKLWRTDPILLYPPVSPPISIDIKKTREQKKNVIVTIGAFEPTKRFGTIIEAYAKSRVRGKAKLIIIGYLTKTAYLRFLQEKRAKLGVVDDVKFLVNISDEDKWDILKKSKVIVHAKMFEPFGIAVAEGMYASCIPIVYKGPLSGPWIDLADRGKHGYGFRDVDELAELIELAFNDYHVNLEKLAPMERAKKFSFENFQKSLIKELTILG